MIRVITIFLLFFYGLSYGVNKAPVLLRACVNKQDSLITINWTSIQDGCGSFKHMDIYGDENDAVYLKVGSITDIAQKSIAIKVNDPTTVRNYFLSIHTLCDGLDSAQSNVIKIDNQAPSSTELDSVSYHFVTQNIIAGWSSNKTPDTERYRLTKPKGSGVDQEIAYTHDTFYTVSTDPHDVFYVKLSTVDSCDFHSPISTPHRVCYLQSAVDTCKKEIKLSWTPYEGWQGIDSQVLYLNKNKAGLSRHSMFNGGVNSYTYKDFVLGDTICFFIRSYKAGSTISSTSNLRCVETRAFIIPDYLYLQQVTVSNDSEIDVSWLIGGNLTDVKTIQLYKGIGAAAVGPLTSFNSNSAQQTTFSYTDDKVDVHSNFYRYQIEIYDQCGASVLISQTSTSILLSLDESLSHNDYVNWDGGVQNYALWYQAPNSSTWNLFTQSSSPVFISQADSGGCYYIEATENTNSYGLASNSVSNVVCIAPELRVFLPNTMNLSSDNNRFIVKGTGIDHNLSNFQIFTRWGEMLADQPTNEAWYGDYRGEKVPQGLYVYVVNIVSLKGERQVYTGIIRVIESN